MNDEEFKTPEEIARENTIFLIVVVCIILSGIYVSKVSRDRINEARGYNKKIEKTVAKTTDNKTNENDVKSFESSTVIDNNSNSNNNSNNNNNNSKQNKKRNKKNKKR